MTTCSGELFKAAQEYIPGGVNSPVRAFRAVGRSPLFIERADGAYLFDVDGGKYLDYVMSWGPMILGHNHPVIREAVIRAAGSGLSFGAPHGAELEMARLMTELAEIEMIRMVNSGTEAVMSALRLARGFTKRDKIIKFEGCYHGHCDSMLVKAGSGLLTGGFPDSAGVTEAAAGDTLIAQYNDIQSVQILFETFPAEVAAVIIEPVCANNGVITPRTGFLQELRELCDRYGALLIFDEVITGFRLGPSGAQGYYGVYADLVTYGKIIGGGLPVGAYGGKRSIMEFVAPSGPVYQAGTLSGNPIAMAAGLAQLTYLRDHPEVYTHIDELGEALRTGLADIIQRLGIAASVDGVGSLSCLFIGKERYTPFFNKMLAENIYLAPSQFEAMFLSLSHTAEHVEETLNAVWQALSEI